MEQIKSLRLQDSQLKDISFWNDSLKIESYCQGIMLYFGITDVQVNIRFDDEAIATQKMNEKRYSIYLPRIPYIDEKNQDLKGAHIFARATFLKHELGHILFTYSQFNWEKIICDGGNVPNMAKKHFINALEDCRVEHQFSSKLKGTKGLFDTMRDEFWKTIRKEVETDDFNIQALGFYLLYRPKGFQFKETTSTKQYEEIYQRDKNYPDYDIQSYLALIEELWKKYGDKQLDQPKQDGDEGQECQESSNRTDENVEDEGDSAETAEDDSAESKNDDSDSKEESQESEADEGNNDGEDGEGDDEEEEEEATSDGSNKTDDNSGDMDKNRVNEKFDEDNEDSDEDSDEEDEGDDDGENESSGFLDDDDDEDDSLENEDYEGARDYSDLINKLNQQKQSIDVDKYISGEFEIDENAFTDAYRVDLIELMSVSSKINFFRGQAPKMGFRHYTQIVNRNKKVIAEAVKFLKLKIQNRNRSKHIIHQEEGILDQDNLKDIFVAKEDPRVFFRTLKTISSDSNMVLLMDFSGSMGRSQKYLCIVNAIIFTEIFKRLNINYEINIFTSGPRDLTIKTKKNAVALKKSFVGLEDFIKVNTGVYSYNTSSNPNKFDGTLMEWKKAGGPFDDKGKLYLNFNGGREGYLYTLKSIQRKHDKKFESVLGLLSTESVMRRVEARLGGSTPEMQSTLKIYNDFKHIKGKKFLFIINDGAFNGVSFPGDLNTQIQKNASSDIFNGFYVNRTHGNYSKQSIITKIKTSLTIINTIKSGIENGDIDVNSSNNRYGGRTSFTKEEIDLTIDSIKTKYYEIMEKVNDLNDNFDISDLCSALGMKTDHYGNVIEIGFVNNQNRGICSKLSDIAGYITNPSYIVYRGIIKKMRTNGWHVSGIGIGSSYGKNYIGSNNFMVVSDAQDISTNFGKKLSKTF